MSAEQARLAATLGGMGLAVAGIALDSRRLIWFAIGVLGLAFSLRFLVRRSGD